MGARPVVCHLTSVHPPEDVRIFYKECSALRDKGYEVHLVYLGDTGSPVEGVLLHDSGPKRNSRFARMTVGVVRVLITGWRVHADVYHFHDPELLFVGLILKLLGKKVVYDVHEDVPRQILTKTWINHRLRKVVAKIIEVIEGIAAQYFDAIVTATPYIGQRFSVINKNTVTINNYPVNDELTIEGIGWDEKEEAICYIGGISELRGIKEMVIATSKTRAKLFLAGDFSPAKIQNTIEREPGWQQVDYHGLVPRYAAKKLIQRSAAGIVIFHPVPNHINAQPNKLFEYMAAGIPVIASDFPLWKEIVEGNNCGICVNPLDCPAITAAIEWLLANPDEARRMGERGRQAVTEIYNWDREKAKLFSLYEILTSGTA